MSDYKEMYQMLFRSLTSAIETMQQAQQAAEEMYLSAGVPDIRILDIAQTDPAYRDEVSGQGVGPHV